MADTSAAGPIAPAAIPDAVAGVTDEVKADATPDFRKYKHKLKINEKEQDLDYDEVIKRAQKSSAADEVFRRASAKEKQLAALIDRAKEGDLDWIEELAGGEKLTKWAEKKLLKIIEMNEMSPEQRELMEERAARKALEEDKKRREDGDNEQRTTALRDHAAKEIDSKIDEAFKAARLPMTPSRIERVAQYLDASLSVEGALLDPAKALQRVQKEMRSDAREVLESLTPEELREFLPKKVLDAIRRGDVADVRAQDPLRRPTPDGQPRKVTDTKQKRMSTDAYFTNLEKKFGG